MTRQILVIDNDPQFTALLTPAFKKKNYEATWAHDSDTGLKKALNQSFDAILLELIVTPINGFETLRKIREHTSLPIIMLASQVLHFDQMLCFEIGADDYLQKPCAPEIIISRLENILRRTQQIIPSKPTIQERDVTLNTSAREVQKDEKHIPLTTTEFTILEMLMRSPGQAFSKQELTEYALNRQYSDADRSIDVHISHLRIKLGDNQQGKPYIKTIRGFGYAYNL